MRIKPFQAVYPNFEFIASPDSFFGSVKREYPTYKKNGFFTKTGQESLYIYQIKIPGRTFTGMIACTDIRDYLDGFIKKHENTLPVKEQRQMQLMLSRHAVVKPVLLTYPETAPITNFFEQYIKKEKPFFTTVFEDEEQEHTFWEVSEGADIKKIQNLFKKWVKETYIADGHHRTSTTALLYKQMRKKNIEGNYHLLLSAFFPTTELAIFDYNRIIDALGGISLTTFMAKLSKIFKIEILEDAAKPKKKHELTLFINKEWYRLTWKKKVLKKYIDDTVVLDATILDNEVFLNIIGIEDVTTDFRIKYVEGPAGLDEIKNRVLKNENKIAFCLYPVKLKELLKVADASEIMPPKSTWFEPRIKNGLIVLDL